MKPEGPPRIKPDVPTGRDTIDWILIAKGIGIILVVVGHFDPRNSPIYWSETRRIIYTFHMPLFFILSGYLYVNGKYSYLDLVTNKVQRLLFPFFAIAAVYLPIKYFSGNVTQVDYPVNTASVLALFTNPVNSYAPLLWFIQALFLMFVFYPLARLFLSDLAILLLFVAVNEAFGSKFPFFGNALAYLPFFTVGVMLRQAGAAAGVVGAAVSAARASTAAAAGGISGRWSYLVSSAAIFSFGTFWAFFAGDNEPGYAFKCLLGVMGSLFVINLSHVIAGLAGGGIRNWLVQLGLYSMTIYLFHALFESAVRLGFGRLDHGNVPFELVALVAIGVGIAVPMVLERELLRRLWITRKFVLGLA
jgi:fucose 4-O-acetylase-like acetyltransferase